MTDNPLLIIGFVLVAWWTTTGLVFALNRAPRASFMWSFAVATSVMAMGFAGIGMASETTSGGALFASFIASLAVWCWIEIGFYFGFVTGPRTKPCEPGCKGLRHFGHAIGVSLYHEIAILTAGSIIAALTWGMPNQLALWVFVVLAVMHQSARLNVFLGVRNVSAEWVPDHLPFLHSFLRKRPMNWFFPISQVLSIGAFVALIWCLVAAPFPALNRTFFWFLLALLGVGIFEHWLLILPLPRPATDLWRIWEAGPYAVSSPVKTPAQASANTPAKTIPEPKIYQPPRELRPKSNLPSSLAVGSLEPAQSIMFSQLGRKHP
ncbi:MAG: putative photosynthetic complex assembly protein PuhE [Pseudomonadota bacterium]